jgi:hypothetical protein
VYIGAGGAIFINTYSYYKRLKYWTNWEYAYTVGGFGYKVKNQVYSSIKLTKDKVTVEYYEKAADQWHYLVKKKTPHSPSPGPAPAPAPARHTRYDRVLQGACVRICVYYVCAADSARH